jgi:hypothetical protein
MGYSEDARDNNCDVKIETYMQGDGYVVDARASAIIHLLASKDGVR